MPKEMKEMIEKQREEILNIIENCSEWRLLRFHIKMTYRIHKLIQTITLDRSLYRGYITITGFKTDNSELNNSIYPFMIKRRLFRSPIVIWDDLNLWLEETFEKKKV